MPPHQHRCPGSSGVTNGSSVTLQFVARDGPDEQLYQVGKTISASLFTCPSLLSPHTPQYMDLTLSSTFEIPPGIQCMNITMYDGDGHNNPNVTSSSLSSPTPTGQDGGALSSMQMSGLSGLSALAFLFSNIF